MKIGLFVPRLTVRVSCVLTAESLKEK